MSLSLVDALDRLVEPFGGGGDWEEILRRAGAPPRPRRGRTRLVVAAAALAVLVALLATPAFGVQGLVLRLLDRHDVSFSRSAPASNEVKKEFEDLTVGAPARWAPQAVAGKARRAAILDVGGRRETLWVVPTRRGGYCWHLSRGPLGCRATAGDRRGFALGYAEAKRPTAHRHGERVVTAGHQPVPARLMGDVVQAAAARIVVRYADGASGDVPFVWVSKPIAAGFVDFVVPAGHRAVPTRVVALLVEDGAGRVLGRQRFPYQPGSTFVIPAGGSPASPARLPAAPPAPPSAPVQEARADGVAVRAGRNGDVEFRVVAHTAAVERLTGHGAGYRCFRLTREFGIFTVRSLSRQGRFASRVGIHVAGVGTPFDGCEIDSSAGHLWPEPNGSHSTVEIPLTAAGQSFFVDRAAARDLALFVRSRRMHALRKEPPRAALTDIRTAYGRSLARSPIGISAAGDTLTFSERSPTGKRFSIVVRRGRIVHDDVRPYAFAF